MFVLPLETRKLFILLTCKIAIRKSNYHRTILYIEMNLQGKSIHEKVGMVKRNRLFSPWEFTYSVKRKTSFFS